MIGHSTRSQLFCKKDPSFRYVSFRLYLFIHRRRPNRNRSIKLIPQRCPPRHILRNGSLPLCLIYGSGIRYFRRIQPLIFSVHRGSPRPHKSYSPLYFNVYRSKPYLFSSTLPRLSRNATTIL